MTVVVSIEGLDQCLEIVDERRFTDEMDRAVEKCGQALRDETKKMPPVSAKRTGYDEAGIPVDTGRMRQSIEKRKRQLLAAEVVARTNYSGFVHDGTGRMQKRPFFVWLMEMFGGQDIVERILTESLKRLAKP